MNKLFKTFSYLFLISCTVGISGSIYTNFKKVSLSIPHITFDGVRTAPAGDNSSLKLLVNENDLFENDLAQSIKLSKSKIEFLAHKKEPLADEKIINNSELINKSLHHEIVKSSVKEIDNKELIEHFGFEVSDEVPSLAMDILKVAHLEEVLANIEKPTEELEQVAETPKEEVNDEIKLSQASSLKDQNDEFVFLDLKKENEEVKKEVPIKGFGIHQLASNSTFTETVNNAIQREMDLNQKTPIVASANIVQKEKIVSPINMSTHEEVDENKPMNKLVSIQIGLLDKKIKEGVEFDFTPDHEKMGPSMSSQDGVISFDYSLNSPFAQLSGVVTARDLMRTRVDQILSKDYSTTEVALISAIDFDNFLKEKNLNGNGGQILIDLNSSVEDISIDSTFEKRFLFDEDLKEVENLPAKYVLFIGANPGNTLLSFRNKEGVYSDKIIQVSEDEIYYSSIEFTKGKVETISLLERTLLGRVNSPLSIQAEKINYFNSRYRGQKSALNSYEVYSPQRPVGVRNYYEFNHLDNTIFAGSWGGGTIELPSSEFMREILSKFNLNSLEGSCLIQINLKNSPTEYLSNGETGIGPMNLNTLFLDKDGVFSDEINEWSSKILILGERKGMIGLKVKYLNEKVDFLNTFCSPNTYLVEQL